MLQNKSLVALYAITAAIPGTVARYIWRHRDAPVSILPATSGQGEPR